MAIEVKNIKKLVRRLVSALFGHKVLWTVLAAKSSFHQGLAYFRQISASERIAKLDPNLSRPTLSEIRKTLTDMGISRGDLIHVQSSVSDLLRWEREDKVAFANAIVDLLFELVGPDGTVMMSTDGPRHAKGWLKRSAADLLTVDDVFDSATTPSRRGLISEVFRNRPNVRRSLHPYYNVAAAGPKAEWLVDEHIKSTPYVQDQWSPWYKMSEVGGKVILLGKTFEVNSPVHLVEFIHPLEFPRPIFLSKAVPMQYADANGSVQKIDVALHISGAPGDAYFVPASLNKFSAYLNEKYGIYKIRDFSNGSQIVVYDAQAQYQACFREMQNNVTWYDPIFLPD